MNWRNNDKTCEVSARLACFKKERKPHLGETFEPNHVLGTCVPETFRFGIRRDKKYGVAELMKDSKPCAAKKDLMDCMVHIIALRDGLNKVYPPFEFNQLLRVLKEYDKDDKGWVAKDVIHEVCKNFKIQTHKEKLEEFMKHAGIMDCNNYVDYKKFCELINLQYELPILKKLNDVPPENLHFETTYHGLLYDKKCDNSGKILVKIKIK
ncbi:hypothetical protein C0J52_08389 [Blattella germanica]|nr:hypothetical protein C0J52_08389 [Blattella germanica]